jgi:hypothetical protein
MRKERTVPVLRDLLLDPVFVFYATDSLSRSHNLARQKKAGNIFPLGMPSMHQII